MYQPSQSLHRSLFERSGCATVVSIHSQENSSYYSVSEMDTFVSLINYNGCSFFAYSWKLPAYSGAFLLTGANFSFFAYSWSFFAYSFSFFTYNWSFFAYSGKVRLIRALSDCKQRSLTVSKKAPAVSKKASSNYNKHLFPSRRSLSVIIVTWMV